MMERVKSIVLALLVASSLLQTYLLAYSQPEFDPIPRNEYVEAEMLGTQEELEQLVFPHEMILHQGDRRHQVLYPEFQFYNMIFDKIKQRTFTGFRRINNVVNWNRLRNSQPGLEIRFKDAVPFDLLRNTMQLSADSLLAPPKIGTIWITMQPGEEEVRTYFLTDSEFGVFEATQADLTVRDVEEFIGFGEFMPEYSAESAGKYYIPEVATEWSGIRYNYALYRPEQLQKSLFVDPAVSRIPLEIDFAEIYTDGKVGLQIYHQQHWMNYTDPVPTVEHTVIEQESLSSAVTFINRHGGWNGSYLLVDSQVAEHHTVLFRQYAAARTNAPALPIVSASDQRFGYIELVLQNGTVTNFERSLIYFDEEQVETFRSTLSGGKTLRMQLDQHPKHDMIEHVFPAYVPTVKDDYVELKPAWAIELENGEMELLGTP